MIKPSVLFLLEGQGVVVLHFNEKTEEFDYGPQQVQGDYFRMVVDPPKQFMALLSRVPTSTDSSEQIHPNKINQKKSDQFVIEMFKLTKKGTDKPVDYSFVFEEIISVKNFTENPQIWIDSNRKGMIWIEFLSQDYQLLSWYKLWRFEKNLGNGESRKKRAGWRSSEHWSSGCLTFVPDRYKEDDWPDTALIDQNGVVYSLDES